MVEYPAMIYKNGRNRGYVANCIIKNLLGFGKTEEAAIDNLKKSLQNISPKNEISVKPLYGISMTQSI